MAVSEAKEKTSAPELTRVDDVRKSVSDLLKRVDNLIRKGELDEAELCVTKAREIDPKNGYAYAFQERIVSLKQQVRQNPTVTGETRQKESLQMQSQEMQTQKEPTSQVPKPVVAATPPESKRPGVTATTAADVKQTKTAEAPSRKSGAEPSLVAAKKEIVVESPQKSIQQHTDSQPKPDDERDQKIQLMIKNAVEAVRKEIELKQMEIKVREQEEIKQREQARVKIAAEAARKTEEQRQSDLRKQSEEQIQQKIREMLQKKSVQGAGGSHTVQPTPSIPPTDTVSEISPSKEKRAEAPVSTERLETLERYKLVLSSVWADGAISEEEEITLNQLRQSLSISAEEHNRLERQVQRETYIEAFKQAWNSGTITPENSSVLAELRDRFKISNEEHLDIESRILWELQPYKNRPTLLVIDDDERLLKVVSKTLNDAGFITTSVTTSDEAYAYLKQSSPDLILCDVNLETSTMGGFAFYEKVREFERLRETPFIFLSGLSDEALIRTGKELGADDYLSKPISEETLVSTIRGKLRRYQDLKKRMN